LYPSDAARRTIENRHVCEGLEQNGDSLVEPREIDHWAHFPDANKRNAFVAEALQLGFSIRALSAPDENRDQYSAQLWRADVPTYNNIDDVTLPLFNLAIEHGGEYDGWESVVVT
jgi:regulator of RNase E activity RraB